MNKLKEYKELKAEIDNITKIVENQGETLKKIHNAIVGDKQFGIVGLVQLVNNNTNWITSQKFFWAKIYGGIAVGTTVVTLITKYWNELF
tara:strand:+ start:1145 stop:1414 length:270 start_codon:yes stop_codon:yes gene_type:complete